MTESLKIENKYQPWHSIRFAGVNDNNSISNNKISKNKDKYRTNNEIESISTEDTASFTSDDDSSELQNIMESYIPFKDSNKTSTQQASNTWIDVFESDDEEDRETYASYPELQEELRTFQSEFNKEYYQDQIQENNEVENETTSDGIPDKQNKETKYSARERLLKAPIRYIHLQLGPNNKNEEEYSLNSAKVIGKIMNFRNEKTHFKIKSKITLVQTYNLKQGLNQFGKEGLKAVQNEMKQVHEKNVFEPINPYKLTKEERNKVMESLIFLQKRKMVESKQGYAPMEASNLCIYQKMMQQALLPAQRAFS